MELELLIFQCKGKGAGKISFRGRKFSITFVPGFTDRGECSKEVNALDCSENLITCISSFPSFFIHINCNNNILEALPRLSENLVVLHCSENNLEFLPELPKTLVELKCSSNKLKSLPKLPIAMEKLVCNKNPIEKISSSSPSLVLLSCSECELKEIPAFPNLQTLDVSDNPITKIENLSSTVLYFYCSYTDIKTLKGLPDTLEKLECNYNSLEKEIKDLPLSLEVLNFVGNGVEKLYLPPKVKEVICTENPLKFIEPLPVRPSPYIYPRTNVISRLHLKRFYKSYYQRYKVKKYVISLLSLPPVECVPKVIYTVSTVLDFVFFWKPTKGKKQK